MSKKFNHILVVNEWHNGEYAGFEAREYWRNDSDTGWNWKQYHNDTRTYTPPTEGISLYAQCNKYTRSGEDHMKEMYGFTVKQTEEITMRDIDQAEANIKRLKAISKKYNALVEKLGTPPTFARFAAYIAECTGATLAEYSNIAGDYISLSVSQLEYKERKLTGKED